MEIHAALNPDKCGNGAAFNVADGEVTTWSQKWSGLCDYFGLVGEGPGEKKIRTAGRIRQEEREGLGRGCREIRAEAWEAGDLWLAFLVLHHGPVRL
jgi:hypothetical protein